MKRAPKPDPCHAVACTALPRPGSPFCGDHWWKLPDHVRHPLEPEPDGRLRVTVREWMIALGVAIHTLATAEGRDPNVSGFVRIAHGFLRNEHERDAGRLPAGGSHDQRGSVGRESGRSARPTPVPPEVPA